MRLAILSDIHGNLTALNRVLKRLDSLQIDDMICLGDVVGYGPHPNDCCNIIHQNCRFCIAGNHDFAALRLLDSRNFNPFARTAINWTVSILTPENKAFLETLNLYRAEGHMLFVHGSPVNPARFQYIMNRYDADEAFDVLNEQICFIGHTHVAGVFQPGYRLKQPSFTVQLRDNQRYIINVGSVGQPRDGDPRAAFAVLDTDASTLQVFRVEYDFRKTQKAMAAAGLPEYLIDRLEVGL